MNLPAEILFGREQDGGLLVPMLVIRLRARDCPTKHALSSSRKPQS